MIGTPEMLCPLMIWRASPTVASGGSVIGSAMIPFSDRLTLSTSRVCSSIDMFLWMTPEAALLGQRDGQLGLGDGVHRRGEDRDVERDLARELGAGVDLAGQELGVAGLEQDVVEGDALVGDAVVHREKLRSGPDREIETTPHDVTQDLMTDKPTDETGEDRVRPGVSVKVGKYWGLSFDIKPGMGRSWQGQVGGE